MSNTQNTVGATLWAFWKYGRLARYTRGIISMLRGIPHTRVCGLCGGPFTEGYIVELDNGETVSGHTACFDDCFDVEVTDKGGEWQSPMK